MGLGSRIQDPEKISSGSGDPGSKRHRIPDPQHLGENLFKKVGVVVGPMRPNFIGFGFEEGRNQAKITLNGEIIMGTLFRL
jgi:hypothetical protein